MFAFATAVTPTNCSGTFDMGAVVFGNPKNCQPCSADTPVRALTFAANMRRTQRADRSVRATGLSFPGVHAPSKRKANGQMHRAARVFLPRIQVVSVLQPHRPDNA